MPARGKIQGKQALTLVKSVGQGLGEMALQIKSLLLLQRIGVQVPVLIW